MDLETYRQLRAQARRATRLPADAEDLVQDTLVAALRAGRADLPWLQGTLRNLAALQARGAVRRKRREQTGGEVTEQAIAMPEARSAPPAWLSDLPAASRRLAVLALHGLSPEEIRWILGLSPVAFRQRLSRLRKALGELPASARAESLALAYLRDPQRAADLQFGLVRRALKAALHDRNGLATHDADGHLLVIRKPGHSWRPVGNE